GGKVEFLLDSALAWLQAGNTAKAKEAWDQTLSLVENASPSDRKRFELDLPVIKAAMTLRLGDVSGGEAAFRHAEGTVNELEGKRVERKKVERRKPCIVRGRALLEERQGKLEDAVVDYRTSLDKAPHQRIESLPYYDSFGMARLDYARDLAKLGRAEEAEAAL